MNNSKHYDLHIDVRGICLGDAREVNYAKTLLRNVFAGNAEEFRQYFGLKIDAPALLIVKE